jgi:hypothetical protein
LKDPQLELISLVLPEGLLDFFELISVGKDAEGLCIYLEEKNIIPIEHRSVSVHSKGFHAEVRVTDFPLRGKKMILCIKRRRWENITTSKILQRDWSLLSQGTRITNEFALFLKGVFR